MADFAAVLKKTLDKMGDTTPEIREKVYEKARETVKRQIAAMEKAPPQAAIDRQFAKLEDAISGVEADFTPVVDDFGLDDILADVAPEAVEPVDEPLAPAPVVEEPVIETPESEVAVEAPEAIEPVDEVIAAAKEAVADVVPEIPTEPEVTEQPAAPDEPSMETGSSRIDEIKARARANAEKMEAEAAAVASEVTDAVEATMPSVDADPLSDFLNEELRSTDGAAASVDDAIGDLKDIAAQKSDDVLGEVTLGADAVSQKAKEAMGSVDGLVAGAPGAMTMPKEKGKSGGIIKTLLVLGVLGGGGYYAYSNQAQLQTMWTEKVVPWWQNLTAGGDAMTENAAGDDSGVPVRTVTTTTVENNGNQDTQEAAPETTTQTEVTDVSEAEPTVKFTQRLTEDGTEVDDGPVAGGATNGEAGEGSSVAPQTAGTADETATDNGEQATAENTEAPEPTVVPSTATPVGQRAIFYEERTGSQEGTALAGATIWSVVNEEPGGDLPVEPAIRAETNIPELGIQMEMTIRRNGDSTFPASHIIELFFRVPDTFEGRGIADVQRVTFKTNEQDPGNALIAVPASLDQNIFLIALTDAATAIGTNVQLMRRENWIDIPMQYISGRRALITFEKGIPGERVFEEVFAAWDAAPIN